MKIYSIAQAINFKQLILYFLRNIFIFLFLILILTSIIYLPKQVNPSKTITFYTVKVYNSDGSVNKFYNHVTKLEYINNSNILYLPEANVYLKQNYRVINIK